MQGQDAIWSRRNAGSRTALCGERGDFNQLRFCSTLSLYSLAHQIGPCLDSHPDQYRKTLQIHTLGTVVPPCIFHNVNPRQELDLGLLIFLGCYAYGPGESNCRLYQKYPLRDVSLYIYSFIHVSMLMSCVLHTPNDGGVQHTPQHCTAPHSRAGLPPPLPMDPPFHEEMVNLHAIQSRLRGGCR